MGPTYKYKYYANVCDGSMLYYKAGNLKGKIPSFIWPKVAPLLCSILYLSILVVGSGMFPLLRRPAEKYSRFSFEEDPGTTLDDALRLLLAGAVLFPSELLLCLEKRQGTQVFDDREDANCWDIASNIDVLKCETAPNLKKLRGAWNKKTDNWLGRYVYTRTVSSLVATYSLSRGEDVVPGHLAGARHT